MEGIPVVQKYSYSRVFVLSVSYFFLSFIFAESPSVNLWLCLANTGRTGLAYSCLDCLNRRLYEYLKHEQVYIFYERFLH